MIARRSLLIPILGAILTGSGTYRDTFGALADCARDSERSDHGGLFFKPRGLRATLGERTRAEVDRLEAGMIESHAAFLQRSRDDGGRSGCGLFGLAGRYLHAQMGLVRESRARGAPPPGVDEVLELALSVIGGTRRTDRSGHAMGFPPGRSRYSGPEQQTRSTCHTTGRTPNPPYLNPRSRISCSGRTSR